MERRFAKENEERRMAKAREKEHDRIRVQYKIEHINHLVRKKEGRRQRELMEQKRRQMKCMQARTKRKIDEYVREGERSRDFLR